MKFKHRLFLWAFLLTFSLIALYHKDRIQIILGIREDVEGKLLHQKAPELEGLQWINPIHSGITLNDLKGKVVLIEFWSYTCGNATNTLPVVKKWDETYRDQGLVIIGIHTPEGELEGILEDLSSAVKNLGISYPVAADNDYRCWTAYGTQYWPTLYLIDQEGVVKYVKVGEGGYWKTERMIKRLLKG
ncbi:redoxin domain-containing protein [candidate division TA06 bacterium]|nr:redoxin domain-containing protein [candidate division TA06 bacterium]